MTCTHIPLRTRAGRDIAAALADVTTPAVALLHPGTIVDEHALSGACSALDLDRQIVGVYTDYRTRDRGVVRCAPWQPGQHIAGLARPRGLVVLRTRTARMYLPDLSRWPDAADLWLEAAVAAQGRWLHMGVVACELPPIPPVPASLLAQIVADRRDAIRARHVPAAPTVVGRARQALAREPGCSTCRRTRAAFRSLTR